jgi:hypothetical protein
VKLLVNCYRTGWGVMIELDCGHPFVGWKFFLIRPGRR